MSALYWNSRGFRAALLVGGLALAALVWLVASILTASLESRTFAKVLAAVDSSPLARDVAASLDVLHQGSPALLSMPLQQKERFRILRIEADIRGGWMVVAAVNEKGPLQDQWDYRYLCAERPGPATFIMSVTKHQTRGRPYDLRIAYSNPETRVGKVTIIDADTIDQWPWLHYNEVVYHRDGMLEPKLSSGYRVMPTNPRDLPHAQELMAPGERE